MKKSKRLTRGRDVTKVLQRNDLPVRNGKGSHIVGTLPDGDKIVYYHGELSKGVRRKLYKVLLTAGLLAIPLVGLLAMLLGGVL